MYMINVEITKNLTGISIIGDYNALNELMDSIHHMCYDEFDDDNSPMYAINNRWLAIAYDVRHAYQGDRELELVDNGMDEDKMQYFNQETATENVYYSCNILFPEAVFVALSVSNLVTYGKRNYLSKEEPYCEDLTYATYLKDKAMLELLSSLILYALEDVIGEKDCKSIINARDKKAIYYNFLHQYLDKCDIEYLKTPVNKRSSKIKNIAKRLVKFPESYYEYALQLTSYAYENHCSINRLTDKSINYPSEIEW